MPEMDGLEVLRRLNDLGYLERLPVFLITAEAVESTMREAYRLGVMDVISKPIIPYVVLRRSIRWWTCSAPESGWGLWCSSSTAAVGSSAEDH